MFVCCLMWCLLSRFVFLVIVVCDYIGLLSDLCFVFVGRLCDVFVV